MIGCRTEVILNWWDKFTHYYIDNWKLSQRRLNDFYLQIHTQYLFQAICYIDITAVFRNTQSPLYWQTLSLKAQNCNFHYHSGATDENRSLETWLKQIIQLSAINSNLVMYYFRLTEFIWKRPVKWHTIKAVLIIIIIMALFSISTRWLFIC